jgi:hypothetical protein
MPAIKAASNVARNNPALISLADTAQIADENSRVPRSEIDRLGGVAIPIDNNVVEHKWSCLCRCRPIFPLQPTHHDPERIVQQGPLQRLRLIPRRPHPDIALLIRARNGLRCPPTLLSRGFGAKIEDLGHSLILEALLCGVH